MAIDGKLPPGEWPRPKQPREWVCRAAVPYATCTRMSPCASCLGRRNRRKGKRGQAQNRRALEFVSGAEASWKGKLANEETADHLPVRYENKAGASGGANKVWTAYYAAERQSEQSRAIGDNRPFVATFSPDGVGDGLVVVRTSKLPDVVSALMGGWAVTE